MLDADDRDRVAEQFGVDDLQVRRDHLISHVLAVLSRELTDDLLFFGGTALARGWLHGGRLSEDIDLIAQGRRADIAAKMEGCVIDGLRAEFPALTWHPPLTQVRDATPAVLVNPDGLTVRIQLLGDEGYPAWPSELHSLEQRYTDASPARLRIPTRPAFVAWKTVAWLDRAASRDLYDLWLLACSGAIDAEAARLYRRYGPTNQPPTAGTFGQAPAESEWRRALAHQTRLTVTAAEALAAVRNAWSTAVG